MRRLLSLVCVLVLVDTMLFAALAPRLPGFAHRLHLSSSGAGVLAASLAAGVLVCGRPGGALAVRIGPRRTVLAGLSTMGVSSLRFALASSFRALLAARLLQGGVSALTSSGAFAWLLAAAPSERRGQLIGTAIGAAVFGALVGPVVGAGAALLGRAPVFCAMSALAVVLIALTLRLQAPPREARAHTALRRASPAASSWAGSHCCPCTRRCSGCSGS